ncbi:hypothetical protein C4D60_Mb00t07390 [Musa balbisiana]|uniref:Uncharacterized protein n=1 Tax=Musa balbisiana TaxID=52838 RepID=A0A4S8I5W9_MUSBA|nr:hypothetical protein C4D60_Mb00t07390 [Musa balbisiana]
MRCPPRHHQTLLLASIHGFPPHRHQHGSGPRTVQWRCRVVVLIEEAEHVWDQEVECYRPLGLGLFAITRSTFIVSMGGSIKSPPRQG